MDITICLYDHALIFIEPGNRHDHSILTDPPGPYWRDIPTLSEQTRLFVMKMRVTQLKAVRISQRVEDSAVPGKLGL